MTTPPPVSSEHDDAPSSGGRTRRLVGVFVLLALTVFAADQLAKVWALANLSERQWQPLIGDWIQLTLVFNPGAALSFGTGMTWLLTIVAAGVTAVVIRSARRLGSRGWAIALGLLLGGALGNLFDRFFRDPGFARGHVVDFIDYFGWFVGNVADIAIVVAAGLIMLQTVRGIRLDGTRESAPRASSEPEGAPSTDSSGA